MRDLAPEIFRKRFLFEGYFTIEVNESKLVDFFSYLTSSLELKTYGDPIVHSTNGVGKASNQGFDAFVPLIDSGIYIAVWSVPRFLSIIMYTCKQFDERRAGRLTAEFFKMEASEQKVF
jgi:hypothetical protein